MKACYDKWRRRSGRREARATLTWGIDVKGGTVNGDIVKTSLGDRDAERCFRGTLQSARFPKPKAGTCQVRMRVTLRVR